MWEHSIPWCWKMNSTSLRQSSCVRHGKCSQLQRWAVFLAPVMNKHGLQSCCWMAQEEVNHSAMSLQSEQKTDSSSFWLVTLLTLVSSSLLAPQTSHPSTVVSASFSTLYFNAITAWGWTTLLHCKEGLILSVFIAVLMNWSLSLYILSNTEVFIYCWTCNTCVLLLRKRKSLILASS